MPAARRTTRSSSQKRRSARSTPTPAPRQQAIVHDTSVVDELRTSFLSYALSVIVARALPDARDGLKPVHRRILYSLYAQRIRPDSPYKKSSRVVGDTMGKYHPHGDSAIYESLVRLAQEFAMRVPLVDPHGNFGSLDDSAAASRYTECRLAPAGMALLADIDEDTVAFVDNYDGTEQEPSVLPAAFPNLLVNGSTGVAVGMATNIPPHNLAEVVKAAVYLLRHPDASTETLLRMLPAPDFPTGGEILDRSGLFELYHTGRGAVTVRATARIVDLPNRRKGIEVTELPYMVGPEKVIERVRDLLGDKRLDGIAAARDFTDRTSGLRLVFEVKPGFEPLAVLGELYRLTPLQDTFAASFVALVDGRPQLCSLTTLLNAYLQHRIDVTRRRSAYRLAKCEARAHLVDGLLVALGAIDDVVALIKASKDTEAARSKLRATFGFSVEQANYILEMPLRKLTSLEVANLRAEQRELRATIASLRKLLRSKTLLDDTVAAELEAVAASFATPRRTALSVSISTPTLAEREPGSASAAPSLEIEDRPCVVLRLTNGSVVRTAQLPPDAPSSVQLAVVDLLETTARATIAAATADGRLHPVDVATLPVLDAGAKPPSNAQLSLGSDVVGLLDPTRPFACMTATGQVKRLDAAPLRAVAAYVKLAAGDRVVRAVHCSPDDVLVAVSVAGQLLKFAASTVRPQGRPAAGMAGIRLAPGDAVLAFDAVAHSSAACVYLATDNGGVKCTELAAYPQKGRATGGVQALRFRTGSAKLTAAAVGVSLVVRTARGATRPAPDPVRRDTTAAPFPTDVAGFARPVARS